MKLNVFRLYCLLNRMTVKLLTYVRIRLLLSCSIHSRVAFLILLLYVQRQRIDLTLDVCTHRYASTLYRDCVGIRHLRSGCLRLATKLVCVST